ncbi:MAG: CarD family transcriptional regulator [Corynebacterium sp.]|nr:CarD family transcriptional regulator [Corynebacterium sp.]
MDFNVGDIVVYPHHGAARIKDREQREFKGEKYEVLVLEILNSDLVIRVPVNNADYVGVRDVVGDEGLRKVFGMLRMTDVEEAGNWSRRYKANQERLASGDVNKVAEVVRDLWRRERDRGLSAGEKRMLSKARTVLVGELALAPGVSDDKADDFEAYIAEVIAAQKVPASTVTALGEDADMDLDLDALSFDDDDDSDD